METDPTVEVVVHTATDAVRWRAASASLAFDASPGSPWLLVPPTVREAFDALRGSGVPLADTAFGSPMLGVKSGCNLAFLVSLEQADGALDACGHGLVAVRAVESADRQLPPRRGPMEHALLRPVVRGQTLAPWVGPVAGVQAGKTSRWHPGEGACQEHIIWTHDDGADGATPPRRRLPPYARRWLGHYRHRLAARSDTRGRMPWWSLFRTESAMTLQPRVVWSDFGRVPRAAVLPAGDPTVPLNTCYVARAATLADAQALAALLNSEPVAAWLNVLAEPARGGFKRYLGWTVGLLTLPARWGQARTRLAPLAARAAAGEPPSTAELTQAVASAYGLGLDALEPLFSWMSR